MSAKNFEAYFNSQLRIHAMAVIEARFPVGSCTLQPKNWHAPLDRVAGAKTAYCLLPCIGGGTLNCVFPSCVTSIVNATCHYDRM